MVHHSFTATDFSQVPFVETPETCPFNDALSLRLGRFRGQHPLPIAVEHPRGLPWSQRWISSTSTEQQTQQTHDLHPDLHPDLHRLILAMLCCGSPGPRCQVMVSMPPSSTTRWGHQGEMGSAPWIDVHRGSLGGHQNRNQRLESRLWMEGAEQFLSEKI